MDVFKTDRGTEILSGYHGLLRARRGAEPSGRGCETACNLGTGRFCCVEGYAIGRMEILGINGLAILYQV
jgi:hypothetical protein